MKAPEDTKSPLLFVTKEDDEDEKVVLLSSAKVRHDGRILNEIRKISIQTDVVHNATGSAYVEMGSTKIIGSVFGPRELARGEEFSLEGQVNCGLKFAPFSNKFRKPPNQEQEEKELSILIGQAMKAATRCVTFPKLQIDINLLVLEDCGSVLSVAVLCASVAMATSGIEMRDLPVACTVSFGKEMFLCDPTSQEEYKPMDYTNITSSTPLTGNLTSIYLSSLGELTGVLQKGVLDVMISSRVMEVCLEGCLRIRERIKTFLNEFETERKRNM